MTTILMTADAVGGVWTYALDLCGALAAHGIRVVLATMGPPPSPAQRREVQLLHNVSLHVSEFRLAWMDDPWEDVRRAGEWLLDLERQTRPDLIHLNGYVHAALDWNAPVLVAAHSCVLSWWAAVKKEPLPDRWLDYAARVCAGLRSADRVVAPSQAMLDALHRHYRGLPPATVIHNGRKRAPFRAATKESFVLSAGRLWDEAKNLAALDDVADKLPWPVRVAGETSSSDGPTRTPKIKVQCLGRLEPAALAEQMSRAAVYALPAKYEPFGLSALEAAFSGCALVLGDIPSLREIWDDAALFVPPDDRDALCMTLRQYIDRPLLRFEMATRARIRAGRYSTAAMANGYLSVYRELLSAQQSMVDPTLQSMKG